MIDEKKLIDFIFEIVGVATSDSVFCDRPYNERMAWVADRLRGMGIDTHPVGSSWGVVVSREFRKTTPVIGCDS